MKTFEPFKFDYNIALQQLSQFERLLASKDELGERKDILPFFRNNRQLSAFIGMLNPNIVCFDVLAYEFDLLGDFACDLVIGDSQSGSYCLIEFEDAKKNSIFRKVGNKSTLEWSPRFEHGFSQIIDWFWALDDYRQTNKYRNLFMGSEIHFTAYLIIGRTKFIGDEQRFRWRRNKVQINAQGVQCFTFDELFYALKRKALFVKSSPFLK